MWLGTLNLNLAAALFGFLSWGIIERGWSQLYFNLSDYGLGYSLLQIFLAWLVIEASGRMVFARGLYRSAGFFVSDALGTLSAGSHGNVRDRLLGSLRHQTAVRYPATWLESLSR
jgi:hypothetical protein